MVSDLNMSNGQMSDFVSFPLFSFTLVIKLRNFDYNPLSTSPTKWSNTLKQFVSFCQQIV